MGRGSKVPPVVWAGGRGERMLKNAKIAKVGPSN